MSTPELPRRPVRDWQIWNEPHFDFYWSAPGKDKNRWAREYVELLRKAKLAIEALDPRARIVLAGLAEASWRTLAQLGRAAHMDASTWPRCRSSPTTRGS